MQNRVPRTSTAVTWSPKPWSLDLPRKSAIPVQHSLRATVQCRNNVSRARQQCIHTRILQVGCLSIDEDSLYIGARFIVGELGMFSNCGKGLVKALTEIPCGAGVFHQSAAAAQLDSANKLSLDRDFFAGLPVRTPPTARQK